MKNVFAFSLLVLSVPSAHAEYRKVNLTVFGMDCAPCAHAIRVSMKGIDGVHAVDVDLNTGFVVVQLTPGNTASMRQFHQAVEKNGFTHKDTNVSVRGVLSGSSQAPFLEVSGSKDRFALVPLTVPLDLAPLLGKTVAIEGSLPELSKGKVSETLRYKSVEAAQ